MANPISNEVHISFF